MLAIAIIGFFVGLTGGMFGIGGSIILIPALTELRGPNQHLYQATAMIMNFCVSAPAVWQHWRARALDLTTIVRLCPLSILFVAVGVGISELRVFSGSGEAYLRGLFGLFLLGCGIAEFLRTSTINLSSRNPSEKNLPVSLPRLNWSSITIIAAPTGLISGLLGIGGGTVAGPLQRRILGTPLPLAIANSTVLVAATAIVGSILKNIAYHYDHGSIEPVRLAIVLAPTAIAGSLLGARLTHRVPLRLLRNIFIVLLIVAALRLILGAIPPPRGA